MKKLFSNNPKAYVIFADTGGEHQTTYDYITDYIAPFCEAHNINFVRVYNKYGKTLYDYCWDKKIVPSIKFRDCTSKFKISPIRKFMRKELGIDR
jgi:3'-phosphoadenosine 5'-phosphosulfate sulfotransferase (PAPS reductase)/FAD synthetase